MKNERPPNYESLLMKQENITTYVGKPDNVKVDSDTEKSGSEKQAFVPPDPKEIPYKYNSLMKKIGEFFK